MKKIILALIIVLTMSGCVNINNTTIDELIEVTMNSKYNLFNHQNKGFKYYLPRELFIVSDDEYNEVIKSKHYDYYLYVDLVRYFNEMRIVLFIIVRFSNMIIIKVLLISNKTMKNI